MDAQASAKQKLLAGESKVSFPTMLKSIQVGDTLQHEGRDLRVITKTFKEKDSGFLIEISLGSVTRVSEQV